ncbi:MAG: fumarylacetoacetate hydrolase family protein [Chloroflexi bacterium]|nr:fumarylacetoacetate hydrolase family protein [Chloroflexota bacterium]MBM4449461.1 fumarylacetoacetate hydrolase family protein [Chloroflexota bacterium]
MKLVTFEISTSLGPIQRIGALRKERIIDLNMGYTSYLASKGSSGRAYETSAAFLPPNMIDFFRSGKDGNEAAETTIDYIDKQSSKSPLLGPKGEKILYEMAEVKLKAPVPRPNSLRDYIAFEGHASLSGKKQLDKGWYEMPVCYKGNCDTIIGPDETILWPAFTDLLDYELEYGIYIGKEGKNIPREKAEEHIAGYTLFNDISARDIQITEMLAFGLGPVKGKDTCSVMGPCLVTPDEIDPKNMRMLARINGEVWSDNNSGTSYWTWPQIIEFASMEETLYPGDFLGSGTVEGGCGLELNRWIQPGDVIELEAEDIGILRNRVGQKPPKQTFTR